MTKEQKTLNQRIDEVLRLLPRTGKVPPREFRRDEIYSSIYSLKYELAENYGRISMEEARITRERLGLIDSLTQLYEDRWRDEELRQWQERIGRIKGK